MSNFRTLLPTNPFDNNPLKHQDEDLTTHF